VIIYSKYVVLTACQNSFIFHEISVEFGINVKCLVVINFTVYIDKQIETTYEQLNGII